MKRFNILKPINVGEKASKTYLDIISSFGEFSYNDANNAQKGLVEGLYDWTMDIHAEDLNDVFASGQEDNYGKGEVKVLGKRRSVSVGDIIAEGDVVCIVEAMKMMNEIKSEFSGEVLSINVENAEPVEYGQSLFELSK